MLALSFIFPSLLRFLTYYCRSISRWANSSPLGQGSSLDSNGICFSKSNSFNVYVAVQLLLVYGGFWVSSYSGTNCLVHGYQSHRWKLFQRPGYGLPLVTYKSLKTWFYLNKIFAPFLLSQTKHARLLISISRKSCIRRSNMRYNRADILPACLAAPCSFFLRFYMPVFLQ